MCGGLRHLGLQSVEEAQPSAAPLPNRTSLLVEGAASGPVFLSLRPHDDGFLCRAGGKLLLSLAGRAAVLFGHQHCGFARCAGDAFPERRAGGHGSGRGAGMRVDYDVCIARLGLDRPPTIAYEPPKLQYTLERLGVSGERFAERREITFIDNRRACVYPRWQRIRGRGAPIFEFVDGVVMQVVGKP